MINITQLFFLLFGTVLCSGSSHNTLCVSEPDMVLVSGGAFTMGCKGGRDSTCFNDEKPAHRVTLRDFYIGRYEVTNAEYCRFLNEKGNQSEGGADWINLEGSFNDEKCRISKNGNLFTVDTGYENHPVIYVSWFGAAAYCAWLSQQTGRNYRLPTEAEWEFAARGGNGTRQHLYAGSDTIDVVAWHHGNSEGQTHAVGTQKANELDLFDCSGNVWEWCADDWHNEYKGAPTNENAWIEHPDRGANRVIRGGGWNFEPKRCRAAVRYYAGPQSRSSDVGFRIARQD